VSPTPTHVSLPFGSSSFHHAEVKAHYPVEAYSAWSSSPSVNAEELPSFRASPLAMDYSPSTTSASTPSNESYHSHDSTQHLPSFPNPTHMYPDAAPPISRSNHSFRQFNNHGHDRSSSDMQNFVQFPLVHGFSDVAGQLPASIFDGPALGLNWGSGVSSAVDGKPLLRAPVSHNAYSVSLCY